MNIFTSIGNWLQKEFTKLSSVLKSEIPVAIEIVDFFKNLVSNPIIDTILKAVSGGIITDAMIATVNTILADLLTGLHDAQAVATMTPQEQLVFFATTFQKLTDNQKKMVLTQLGTQIVLAKDPTATNAKITALTQAAYSKQNS